MHVEQGKAGFDPSDPRSLVAIADQQREEELAKKKRMEEMRARLGRTDGAVRNGCEYATTASDLGTVVSVGLGASFVVGAVAVAVWSLRVARR